MAQALFYLLPPAPATPAEPASQTAVSLIKGATHTAPALAEMYMLACRLAQQAYSQQKWVYIHCNSQAIAFEIDELLWQFEPSAFVPHNLKGEGPMTGSPVEIGFDKLGPNKSRQLLINLADQVPQFAVNFGHIIDFVASDDNHKAIARERYRQYRGLGVTLQTQDLATHPLNLV